MIDDVVNLTSQLVAIDSVNPALVYGGAGEAEIASFIADWGRGNGLDTELVATDRARPSVILRSHGTGGGRTLVFCGHIDTVSVAGVTDPHEPRLRGDRLYGRGAYDMKAGLAAALLACREVARRGLRGDVVVAAVADEEHASLGVEDVLRSLQADGAIVTEPTELEVAVAHKGFIWSEVEVTGRASHGSRPQLGVDAIVKSGPILTAIGRLDSALGEHTHPLLGRPSVHASLIRGGVELSSLPAQCVISLERRTLPSEHVVEVEAELDAILDQCRAADPDLMVVRRTLLAREPFEIDPGAEIVRAVRTAAADEIGHTPPITGASYWADTALISAAGIPTVLFGPGGDGAHAIEEWVSIKDTAVLVRTLTAAAMRFCT